MPETFALLAKVECIGFAPCLRARAVPSTVSYSQMQKPKPKLSLKFMQRARALCVCVWNTYNDSHPAGRGTPSSYIRPAAVMHARMHVTHGRTSGHIASVSPSVSRKRTVSRSGSPFPARPHSCTNQLRYISESFGKAQTMRAIIDATPPHAPSRVRYCLGVTGSIL